jgi:hypothetical protein
MTKAAMTATMAMVVANSRAVNPEFLFIILFSYETRRYNPLRPDVTKLMPARYLG